MNPAQILYCVSVRTKPDGVESTTWALIGKVQCPGCCLNVYIVLNSHSCFNGNTGTMGTLYKQFICLADKIIFCKISCSNGTIHYSQYTMQCMKQTTPRVTQYFFSDRIDNTCSLVNPQQFL